MSVQPRYVVKTPLHQGKAHAWVVEMLHGLCEMGEVHVEDYGAARPSMLQRVDAALGKAVLARTRTEPDAFAWTALPGAVRTGTAQSDAVGAADALTIATQPSTTADWNVELDDHARSRTDNTVCARVRQGDAVIARFVTFASPASMYLSRNRAAWRASSLVLHAASRQRAGTRHPPDDAASAPDAGAVDAISWAYSVWSRARMRKTSAQRWWIALGASRPTQPPQPPRPAFPLTSPAGHFYADPMLAKGLDGQVWLLFEDWVDAQQRAHLAAAAVHIDSHGSIKIGEVRPILARPHHLSYPHVLAHDGLFWMTPEQRSARRVELFTCTQLPGPWEPRACLLRDVDAVDPTLLHHEGHFYLFVGVKTRHGSCNEELHAFVSAQIDGPYHPHPANPLVRDVRCARPAGPFVRTGTVLIRPAQDCARGYGHQIRFMQVTTLTPTRYAEALHSVMPPNWYAGNSGTHTYSSVDGVVAVDASFRVARA